MPLKLTLQPDPYELYRSDFDVQTTLDNLNALDGDAAHVTVTRTGKTEFTFDLQAESSGNTGTVRGKVTEGRGGRARVLVAGRYRRNRQLIAVGVSALVGLTAMIAVNTGAYIMLLIVPAVLVIGSGVIDRRTRGQRAAMAHLRACITQNQPTPARRKRLKKRQWGKQPDANQKG